jgi:CRISPR/Cas system Type II protein with McrA/HNH and RuvC-like nuclease domain
VSDEGHRCEERSGLEFDHIKPFAIGGDSSASNVRLLCSTHNQYEAERTYGADFMSLKRGRAAS